jgi:hypothetical protein
MQIREGVQYIGGTSPVSIFQAMGIASYEEGDAHQNRRQGGLANLAAVVPPADIFSDSFHLNLFNMQPADSCLANPENNGVYPCNANTEFQQHGYSTTMRDRRFDENDPDGINRFRFWIQEELVVAPEGVPTNERVLLLDGWGRILAKARTSTNETEMFRGDFSGEFSLLRNGSWEGSNLQRYHNEINGETRRKVLAVWQPLLAWAAWWNAFKRPYGEHTPGTIAYFTETDIEDFFLRSKFPDDWEARVWGLKEAFATVDASAGMGITDGEDVLDYFVNGIVGPAHNDDWSVRNPNPERLLPREWRYFVAVKSFFEGMLLDMSSSNVHNTYPSTQN